MNMREEVVLERIRAFSGLPRWSYAGSNPPTSSMRHVRWKLRCFQLPQ